MNNKIKKSYKKLKDKIKTAKHKVAKNLNVKRITKKMIKNSSHLKRADANKSLKKVFYLNKSSKGATQLKDLIH